MATKMWRGIKQMLEYAWGYMGTLAALGLLVGVLGMGIYHAYHQNGDVKEVRCFTGLFNSAAPEAPRGIGLLACHSEQVSVPHVRFEYGEGGRMERLVHVDAEGNVTPLPGSKVAEQRVAYDDAGRVVARRNYDSHGAPVADSSGISVREFEYDDAGRLVRNTLRNEYGQKVVPRMPGFAEKRISYDEKGRPLCIQYLDGEGRAVTNARGENCIRYEYDDDIHSVTRSNTIDGSLANNALGYAIESRHSTSDGRTVHTAWKDSHGEPVRQPEHKACSLLEEHDKVDHLVRVRFCGENGVMRNAGRTYAEHLVRMNSSGLVEWECYNADDGLPCLNEALGYAERVCEYTPQGELDREYFWDAGGNPSSCYEKRYTVKDGVRHVLSLNTDGSTEIRQE